LIVAGENGPSETTVGSSADVCPPGGSSNSCIQQSCPTSCKS